MDEEKDWVLYIIECSDNTLYTGITNDLTRRLQQHTEGKGGKYTRTRLPAKPRFSLGGLNRSQALTLEVMTKRLSRAQKEELMKMQGKFWRSVTYRFGPVFATVYKEEEKP